MRGSLLAVRGPLLLYGFAGTKLIDILLTSEASYCLIVCLLGKKSRDRDRHSFDGNLKFLCVQVNSKFKYLGHLNVAVHHF